MFVIAGIIVHNLFNLVESKAPNLLYHIFSKKTTQKNPEKTRQVHNGHQEFKAIAAILSVNNFCTKG